MKTLQKLTVLLLALWQVGIEFAAFESATLRLEGLYYNFGSDTYEQDQDPGEFMRIDNEILVARVGLTFAF